MKIIKNILIVLMMLTMLAPCGHALVHHDHEEHGDHKTATVLCTHDRSPCECHDCAGGECPDSHQIPFERENRQQTVVAAFTAPAEAALWFTKHTLSPVYRPPPVRGMLAALQTIQLLI